MIFTERGANCCVQKLHLFALFCSENCDRNVVAPERGVMLIILTGAEIRVRFPGEILLGDTFEKGLSLVALDFGDIQFLVAAGGPLWQMLRF